MSLIFNMLSRLVIAFLKRSKSLLISWLQSLSAVILQPPKIVSHFFHCFPSICHEVMILDAMIFLSWMLSFKQVFSLSFFTFIKRLFNSSLLSAIRVLLSAYLRLSIFHPTILIPAGDSSSLTFHMMYSAYMLNKQGDNIQPWCTAFSILKQSLVSCPSSISCFLTCIHISQEAIKVIWYSHLLKNLLQFVVIHTIKGFSVVSEAELEVFLEFSCFFYDPVILAIWSLVPLPFRNPASASGSSRFMYCWSLAWRILSITLLSRETSTTVWSFEYYSALPFFGIGMKTDLF